MRTFTAPVLLVLLALFAPTGAAQEKQAIVVGSKEAAPFSFRDAGTGEWKGLTIDLLREAARDLELDLKFEEASLENLITGLQDGRFDASAAALTVTPEREEVVDFTHAYFPSGLGIAVQAEESGGLVSVLANLFTVDFAKAVGTLVLVLFAGAAVLWLLERRRNAEQFGGSAAKGLGAAFWWSAVTMTTVGYGDKAPVTLFGRLIGVVWMFAGVITISGLTATIASSLTVSRLEHSIRGPEDLPSVGRVGCISGTTSAAYAREEKLDATTFESAADALRALESGRVTAVVYDQPILRYLVNESHPDLDVLPVTFERQDYAIALPLESSLRKPLNGALVERISSESWDEIRDRYLGR